MSNSSDIQAGAAYVDIQGNTKPFDKAMDSTESRFSGFVKKIKDAGEGIRDVGAKLAMVGGAMAAPALAGIKAFADYGAVVGRLSARTGLDAGLIGGLKYAADQFEVPIQAVAKGVSAMERGVSSGSAKASGALQAIGLSMKDVQGLSAGDRFNAIADALSKVGDEGMQAAYSQQIFGNSGLQMLPFIKGGAAEIQRLSAEARTLGLVLSGEASANAKSLDESMKRLTGSVQGARLAIGESLYPVIKPLVDRFVDLTVYVGQQIRQNPEMVKQWAQVAATFVGVGAGLAALGSLIALVTSPALIAAGTIMMIGGAVMAVRDLVTGNDLGFGKLFNSIRIDGVGMGTWLAEIAMGVQEIWLRVTSTVTNAFEKIKRLNQEAALDKKIDQARSLRDQEEKWYKEGKGKQHLDLMYTFNDKYNKLQNERDALLDPKNDEGDKAIEKARKQIELLKQKMTAAFQADDTGDGENGFRPEQAKEAARSIFKNMWDGIGDQFKSLLGGIPHIEFPEAKKVEGNFGPDRSYGDSSGTFSQFGGSGFGASGTLREILSEHRKANEKLGQIVGNTAAGTNGNEYGHGLVFSGAS